MRNLIVGDIHGCYDKLMRVLENAKFSDTDFLTSVGDFCDRGDQNLKVLEFLMSLPRFKAIRGNHDVWLYNYLYSIINDRRIDNESYFIWTDRNGGNKTVEELRDLSIEKLNEIFSWLKKFPYILSDNKFIVLHGGPLNGMTESQILGQSGIKLEEGYDHTNWAEYNTTWYRNYTLSAITKELIKRGELDEEAVDYAFIDDPIETDKTIFVGHTPICNPMFKNLDTLPFISEEYHLINVDTGSYKKNGKITVMDMDSRSFWQS